MYLKHVLWKVGGGGREGRGGVGGGGILARVGVPCVSRDITFNRTFGSYYIIEGELRKGTASSRSVQAPLSGGGEGGRGGRGGVCAWNVLLIFNTNKQPYGIGRGNNNLSNSFFIHIPVKRIDNSVIKKSVPAMAAIYGTYTTDNVYMQLQNNDAARVVNYIDEQKLLQ